MSFAFTVQDLAGLTADQKAAIMESLVMAVLADGGASRAETARFDLEVDAIPWGMEAAEVKAGLEAARARIVQLAGEDVVIAYVKDAATRMPGEVLREKVFRAMASIMYSSREMTRPAAAVLAAYSSVFELPLDRMNAIKAAVKGT
jgi:hypothetical protein